MWACAAAMLGVAVLALLLRFYLARVNRGLEAAASGGSSRSAGADLGATTDEEAQGLVSSYDSRGGRGDDGLGKGGQKGFRYML